MSVSTCFHCRSGFISIYVIKDVINSSYWSNLLYYFSFVVASVLCRLGLHSQLPCPIALLAHTSVEIKWNYLSIEYTTPENKPEIISERYYFFYLILNLHEIATF